MPSKARTISCAIILACAIGCIGGPPGSQSDGGTTDGQDASDGGRDGSVGDMPVPDMPSDDMPVDDLSSRDMADDVGDGGMNDATGDFGPDMNSAGYQPLPVLEVAWIGEAGTEVRPVQSNTFRLYLHLAMNAHIAFESPQSLSAPDYDLIFASADSGTYEDDLPGIAAVSTPLVGTSLAEWNELGLAVGAAQDVVASDVSIVGGPDARTDGIGNGSVAIYPDGDGQFDARETVGAGAEVMAEQSTGYPTYFTYDVGAEMADSSTAAARRVGFGLWQASRFNRIGFRLFDSAVDWGLGRTIPTPLTCHLVTDGSPGFPEYAVAGRLRLHGCDVRLVAATAGASVTDSDLVVVHSDVVGSNVGMVLRGLQAPVVVLVAEGGVLQGLGMVDSEATGQPVNTAEWVVRAGADEDLRAGFDGAISVVTPADAPFRGFPLADLPPGASPVAGDPAVSSNAVFYWAIEEGGVLFGVDPAVGRRVALAVPSVEDRIATRAYLELLDAAIQWSMAAPL